MGWGGGRRGWGGWGGECDGGGGGGGVRRRSHGLDLGAILPPSTISVTVDRGTLLFPCVLVKGLLAMASSFFFAVETMSIRSVGYRWKSFV